MEIDLCPHIVFTTLLVNYVATDGQIQLPLNKCLKKIKIFILTFLKIGDVISLRVFWGS